MDRRRWTLALDFQEVFTIVGRVRYNRQAVTNAEYFRAEMKKLLRVAEQKARSHGYGEDVKQAVFALVAFVDESILGSRNPVFADWARLPLQAELFQHQLAGEIFFQELQKTLNRPDSLEVSDLLEVYSLCLLLGFKGRYAAGGAGDLRSILSAVTEKIHRIRGTSANLSPRGLLPADAVRLTQSDPWVPKLALVSTAMVVVTLLLFILFKLLLINGAALNNGITR
jgi:type VI secretion system protein ImpK